MLSKLKPAKGRILISEPFMVDPSFKRSVVFLTDHDEKGSVGFVLNQPLGINLKDVVDEDVTGFNVPIYCGGPVQQDMLHFLHTLGEIIPDSVQVGDGIYWGGDFDTIITLILNQQIQSSQIKFFIGYSGWSEEQLNEEIVDNNWIVGRVQQNDVFDQEENLWKRAIKKLGAKYAHIANFPENPMMN